jgi:hypothetical protein
MLVEINDPTYSGECKLESIKGTLTILYEDNACIVQIKEGYIKGVRSKHISSKFFSTHDFRKDDLINVCQIKLI